MIFAHVQALTHSLTTSLLARLTNQATHALPALWLPVVAGSGLGREVHAVSEASGGRKRVSC